MVERFRNLRDEQLDVGIIMMAALCVAAVVFFFLLRFSGLDRQLFGRVESGGTVGAEATLTPEGGIANLPPTWTPRPTNTATATATPSATPTETVEPTETTEPSPTRTRTVTPTASPTTTATEGPDFAATISAAQSATPPPLPPQPPAPAQPTTAPLPPAPAPPAPAPPAPAPPVPTQVPVPTQPPPPTPTPEPSPTPLPLYVLADLRGGPDCGYVGISGTILNGNGTPRPGVTVEVFNEFGYRQALTTDASGVYEAFLDTQPRADLAGFWHIRVLENGVQQSNEILVVMSGSCTTGETRFVADFYRTQQ